LRAFAMKKARRWDAPGSLITGKAKAASAYWVI
jgi:hypothetical protein